LLLAQLCDCIFEVTVSPNEMGETPDGRGTMSVPSKLQQIFVYFFHISKFFAKKWSFFFIFLHMAEINTISKISCPKYEKIHKNSKK